MTNSTQINDNEENEQTNDVVEDNLSASPNKKLSKSDAMDFRKKMLDHPYFQSAIEEGKINKAEAIESHKKMMEQFKDNAIFESIGRIINLEDKDMLSAWQEVAKHSLYKERFYDEMLTPIVIIEFLSHNDIWRMTDEESKLIDKTIELLIEARKNIKSLSIKYSTLYENNSNILFYRSIASKDNMKGLTIPNILSIFNSLIVNIKGFKTIKSTLSKFIPRETKNTDNNKRNFIIRCWAAILCATCGNCFMRTTAKFTSSSIGSEVIKEEVEKVLSSWKYMPTISKNIKILLCITN